MNWGNPDILYLLLLIPIFLIFISISTKKRKKLFIRLAESRFYDYYLQQFSGFHWVLKGLILTGALFFLIIAAARPQWNKEVQIIKKEGIDIVVCLDVSKSMDARDIQPSRLERAKDQISLFIDQLKGDRIALVAFAGRSYVQCPLTDDYGAAKLFLGLLDSETVLSYGTNIGGAIDKALSLFRESDKHKIIIIVSDGEDLEDMGIKEAEKAADLGARIYTLGIGSPEGSTIPVEESPGNIVYAKDDKGDIILTQLDVRTLNQIADLANGKFFPITPHQSEIFEILQNINSIEKKKYESREYIKHKEQYKYFVILTLLFLIIESIIYYKKKGQFKRVL